MTDIPLDLDDAPDDGDYDLGDDPRNPDMPDDDTPGVGEDADDE